MPAGWRPGPLGGSDGGAAAACAAHAPSSLPSSRWAGPTGSSRRSCPVSATAGSDPRPSDLEPRHPALDV